MSKMSDISYHFRTTSGIKQQALRMAEPLCRLTIQRLPNLMKASISPPLSWRGFASLGVPG